MGVEISSTTSRETDHRHEVYHGTAHPQVRRSAHPPARGGRRGVSSESGAEGLPAGGADLHASQCDTGGDRRAAGRVPAHCLAGHRGHDRGDRPGPEGHAAHRGGGARGLRLRARRHPLPLLELARSPRIVVGQAWDDRHERPDPGPARRQAGVGLRSLPRLHARRGRTRRLPDCSTGWTPPDGSPTRDTSAGE